MIFVTEYCDAGSLLSSKIEEMSNELASVNGRIRDIKPDGLSLPSVDHICKCTGHIKRAGWGKGEGGSGAMEYNIPV